METISGLPKPDLTPRQTDVAYAANRLTSIDTLWTIPPDYPATGASYAHDAAGNIVSDGLPTDYFYNQNNRLIRVEIDGLTVAEYAYDAFERRVKKIVNGVTTHFHYDLNGLLISETDGNGNPRKDYVYLNGEPVAMKVYGGSAGWYWFVNDHLGTPQKMVDEAGSVVWAAAYAPFGEARVYEDEVTNNLRFPGQYYDVETGLHYNWHRYYDPGTGRYLTPDPIGLAGGMNLYAYAFNDPANFIDPDGKSPFAAFVFAGGAMGGPPGAAIGAAAGVILGVGVYGAWDLLWNESAEDGEECEIPKGPKGTPKDAQKKLRKGQGPRDVDRIDPPEPSVPGSQWHVHGKGKQTGGINVDGSPHDKKRGNPDFSKKTKKWLNDHGWKGLE